MGYELHFTGKKLKLNLEGEEAKPKELRKLLDTVYRVEGTLTEPEMRERVVRQLKSEIIQDGSVEEDLLHNTWWDLPQDLLRNKETSGFIQMEADLNPAVHYEKSSFLLTETYDEGGKHYLFSHEQLEGALRRLQLQEKLGKTTSILARCKGNLDKLARQEVEDTLRKQFSVPKLKVTFQKRSYGERASLEIIMFGDYLNE